MTVATKTLIVPFSYSSLTILLSRLTRFWMSVLSVMLLPPKFMKTTSGRQDSSASFR